MSLQQKRITCLLVCTMLAAGCTSLPASIARLPGGEAAKIAPVLSPAQKEKFDAIDAEVLKDQEQALKEEERAQRMEQLFRMHQRYDPWFGPGFYGPYGFYAPYRPYGLYFP